MTNPEQNEIGKITDNWFIEESLRALKTNLAKGAYPGYPTDRLNYNNGAFRSDTDSTLILPDGPWETSGLKVPSLKETMDINAEGLETDDKNRPIHPWIEEMLGDYALGVVTGKGAYWKWGPNYTADPIVTRETKQGTEILLIQRSDTGYWALPGGFVDKDEDPIDTAVRETFEESGINIAGIADAGIAVYDGPLADLRVTANAWPHTFAYHFDATGLDTPDPSGSDDAVDAMWTPVYKCQDRLFGSHALLIAKALE